MIETKRGGNTKTKKGTPILCLFHFLSLFLLFPFFAPGTTSSSPPPPLPSPIPSAPLLPLSTHTFPFYPYPPPFRLFSSLPPPQPPMCFLCPHRNLNKLPIVPSLEGGSGRYEVDYVNERFQNSVIPRFLVLKEQPYFPVLGFKRTAFCHGSRS